MRYCCIIFFLFIGMAAAAADELRKFSPGSDTLKIIHKQDGLTGEWPATSFETDLGTDIRFAMDNDSTNLYLAMNITNEGIQQKILKMGMNLYIDLKGKRKEGRGVTFPIRDETKEPENLNKDLPPDRNSAQKKLQEKKLLRSSAKLHLVYMKIFGFDGSGKQDQGLTKPGSINIAFTWDSLDVLHLEYEVPLQMLGQPGDLKSREISIGWKLNGMYPSDNPRYYSETANLGKNGQQKLGADNKPIIERETIIREQNIWKKYLFVF